MGSKVHRRRIRRRKDKTFDDNRCEGNQRSGKARTRGGSKTSQTAAGDSGCHYLEYSDVGACVKCWIRDRCMEQRGRCELFKTQKQVRKEAREDARRINESYSKGPAGAEDHDEAGMEETGHRVSQRRRD